MFAALFERPRGLWRPASSPLRKFGAFVDRMAARAAASRPRRCSTT
jgi:hypothetical protein